MRKKNGYKDPCLETLILVPTLPVSRHLIPGQTVAVVALLRVHTPAVRTEVGVEGALVYPPGEVSRNIPTQQLVLRCAGGGAGLAQVGHTELPALAHGLTAATVNLGQLEGHLTGALPATGPREGGEAVTLPTVQTAESVLGGDEAWLADAVVAGVSVDTPAVVTVVLTSLTLVLVLALVLGVHHGALRTDAGE